MQKEPSISELENKLKDMVGPSGGLQEVRWVNPYVNLLNETKYPGGHDFLLQALLRSTVNSKVVYDKFANIGGLEFLGKLIKDYDKSDDPEAKSLLHTIIDCLSKFSISVELLETTKIGKALGGLLKHPDVSIQNKSGALIKNWKDILLAPSESARPPKPNYNETKIEIPKRQKVEEDSKPEESAEYIIEQYNEIDDYSNKHVRWVDADHMENVKYFWRGDEPAAQCATSRPYDVPPTEPHENISVEDFRKREVQMEKELNHKEKERDEMTKKSLENMSPKVPFYTPNKILISVSQRSKIESAEQLEEVKRENGVLRTIYQRDGEIPTAPIETAATKPVQAGNIQHIPASKYGHFPTVIKLSDEDDTKDDEEKELESYTQQSSYQPQNIPQFHSMTPPDMNQPSQMMPPMSHMSMPPPPPGSSQPLISHMPQPMMGMPQNIPMMPMNQMYMQYPQNQNYQMPQMGPYGQMMNQPPPQPHRMQPSYQPQTMQFPTNDLNRRQVIYNPITKKPLNYKTMPCRKFHSGEGCERGDNCHFIHDFQYQGRPIPNFQEWKNSNQERLQNLMASKQDEGAPSYYPPMNYPPDYNKY